MPGREKKFLTVQEALAAIRIDFFQYTPQQHLFLELCPIILGSHTTVTKDPHGNGVWISISPRRRMAFLDFRELGGHLCDALERSAPSPDLLAAVCRRVFRTRAYPGTDRLGKTDGVWIETGMETFSCHRCGHCCQTLQFHTECTARDYELWEARGRRDITEWVGLVRKNGIVSYQIWVVPGTRQYADVCPWLREIPDQNRYECRIRGVRPEICRQYPGSRKHADMTGCMGCAR